MGSEDVYAHIDPSRPRGVRDGGDQVSIVGLVSDAGRLSDRGLGAAGNAGHHEQGQHFFPGIRGGLCLVAGGFSKLGAVLQLAPVDGRVGPGDGRVRGRRRGLAVGQERLHQASPKLGNGRDSRIITNRGREGLSGPQGSTGALAVTQHSGGLGFPGVDAGRQRGPVRRCVQGGRDLL